MQQRRGADPLTVLQQQACCWPSCTRAASAPSLPLCDQHVLRVVHHARDLLVTADSAKRSQGQQRQDGVVYFLRFRDLIKIGWTSNLRRRLASVPHDALLHHLPGTRADEKRLHAAFEHLREYREWFRPAPDLLAFIEHLQHAGAVDDLAG